MLLNESVLLPLQLLNLALEPGDDFLRLVRSLRQLLFYLLVQRDVALQDLNLLGHLVMSLHELLCVLGLIVKLGCQLVVLQDGQSCLRLELFIVEGHQVSLRFLHLEVHLLRQLLHVLDLLKLSLVDPDHAFALLLLVLDFKVGNLLDHGVFASLQFFIFDLVGFKDTNLRFVVLDHLLVLLQLRLMILIVPD